MAVRKIETLVDEILARRLSARAADLGKDLGSVIQQELAAWLGDWGLRFRTYIVQSGDTLSAIAARFYGDRSKAAVIAAFNAIANPNLIEVGQELLLPEVGGQEPLPQGESPFIFGLHDRGGEYYMDWAGRKGWVLCTEELGADPNDQSSKSYRDLAENGYGVLVRLNHGYNERGTLPTSDRYGDFARRCGNFVARSEGCHIWIIGNEPNLAVERPGGPENGEWITPEKYATAFRLCRQEIRSRPGHERDQVVVAAVGPWNIQTSYEGNPSGDWIIYFEDMLKRLQDVCDGIALHTYARDPEPANIVSEDRMDPPFDHRRKMFRTYIDFMQTIPQGMRHLPVYITEANQNAPWADENRGWIQEAYAEINRWNANPVHQKIRCMLLYRWGRYDQWAMEGKAGVIADFRAALQRDYRWCV